VAYYPFLDPTIPASLTVPFCFLILIGGLGLRVKVRGLKVRVRVSEPLTLTLVS